MVLESLLYDKQQEGGGGCPSLKVLDQLKIPQEKVYIDVPNMQTTWKVIHDMNIRGAPLIAIVACLGLAVDLQNETSTKELDGIEHMSNNPMAIYTYIQGKMDYLATSRPTAVNLFNALQEIKDILDKELKKESTDVSARQRMVQAVQQHAEYMLERDVADNRNIGKHGAERILSAHAAAGQKVKLMTICNTGSLATASYGTALGVVRALHEQDQLEQIVALETRPYNQGARLTAFEMVEDNMPNATLICDSMAAACMSKFGINAVLVGADRICANGDTANKIGTLNVSIVAQAYQVPVYVAAPFTTLDLSLASGSEIPIEERPANELLESSQAPSNVNVWNPAFDVTPAKYLAGIITEKGVILPNENDGSIDVKAFVEQHS